jgi:hypothetical protein
MRIPEWLDLLAPVRRGQLAAERAFRGLTPQEVLEARREGYALAEGEEDLALCSNAALIARSLEKGGKPVFQDAGQVLAELSPLEIEELAQQWAEDTRDDLDFRLEGEHLEDLLEELQGRPRERLRWRVLKTFSALPTEQRAREMTQEDYLWCGLNLMLDLEESLDALCPSCREKMDRDLCPVCGREKGETNLGFDMADFWEKKCRREDQA